MNLIFSLFRIRFLQATQTVKIKFEVDYIEIKFLQLDFWKKSSTLISLLNMEGVQKLPNH